MEKLMTNQQVNVNQVLDNLIQQMEKVNGIWDGDNSGKLEDQAHIADDIVKTAKQLNIHLEEMAEYTK